MKNLFYLSSHDWGEPWGPRKCTYLATYEAKPTGQVLFYVKVSPVLAKWLSDDADDVNKLLLGTISNDWSLKDIGRFGFFVDIYIPKCELNRTVVNVKDLLRVGVGMLHKTREEAELY